MSRPFTVAIDFDQTLARGPFPECGEPVPMAFEYLRILQQRGARLILYTMRSDGRNYPDHGRANPLATAVAFCKTHGVEFWAHNCNPEQADWTGSPKVYADLYIDDAAFGVPMTQPDDGGRPYVNWAKVGPAAVKLLDEYLARRG